VLVPELQVDLYEAIMAGLIADTLVEPYKLLRKLAANYLASYLYRDILPTLDVVMTEDGALRAVSDFDGINNRKLPSAEQLRRLYDGLDLNVMRNLTKLREFIKANVEELPEYIMPLVDEDTAAVDALLPFQRNRERKRVFGL
jgi:hypothetical protein